MGFKKQRNKWQKKLTYVSIVVELQASRLSNAFYINLGVVLNHLHPNSKNIPAAPDWHLRARFNRIIGAPKPGGGIVDLEDINSEEDFNKSLDFIKLQLESTVLPELEKFDILSNWDQIIQEEKDATDRFMLQNLTLDDLKLELRQLV